MQSGTFTRRNLMLSCILAAAMVAPQPALASQHPSEVVWKVATSQKVIALTFDDGPDPIYTPQVLDILRQYYAKATFFVIGMQAERYPQIIQREVAEGHELANHTYHHPKMKDISDPQLRAELELTREVIQRIAGTTPHYFRPPEGVFNDAIVKSVKDSGYKVVMWSGIDVRDWSQPGVEKIVDTVLDNAQNGSIVMLHDHGSDRSQTVAALKEILPALENRGYRFVTISELLQTQNES